MKRLTKIFAGNRTKKSRFGAIRLVLGLFVAFLLPLFQTANFVHIIAGEHEIHTHGHRHFAHGHHHDLDHDDSNHHNHSSEDFTHSHNEHGPDCDHHTATDHLDGFHMWKPNPKVFNPAIVAILATQFLAFIEIPRDVTWPRDKQQRVLVQFDGPPPQLRAPPFHS